MSNVHSKFLGRVADSISELMLILGSDWPSFREQLLAIATDALKPSEIADAIVNTALPGPAASLIRRLMRESSVTAG